MLDDLAIRIRGGGVIQVPGSAAFLSTYVLLEQEDWFEKEIAFVRRYLEPGMRALDIGANFGCYSVALARSVGPGGAAWLYEPASTTFGYLRRTLAANSMGWAHAHQLALSDREGAGTLSMGTNPELNSLAHAAGDDRETVQLTTLDRARVTQAIDAVDFLKLDAEGEELRIVEGGREFFGAEDPLVMFEVRHAGGLNVELPNAFSRLGYGLYRLVGPDTLLVPVAADEELDEYELNLFACKPGRAARLHASGCLIQAAASAPPDGPGAGFELWRRQRFAESFSAGTVPRDAAYARALDRYALWRDATRTAADRHAALELALHDLSELVGRAMTVPRLFTLARIAREAGARSVALKSLQAINRALGQGARELDEPCWPALERYDSVDATAGVMTWITASAAEALITSAFYSGYFSGPTALPILDWLHDSPHASAPMERRRQLQAIWTGRQRCVEGSELLRMQTADHQNPELWADGVESWIPASLKEKAG